jgi:type I restriction enzyme S subunit
MLRTNETVFLGQRLVSYRANPECLDNRFLLYSLQADYLQAQIKALGSGATVEHMRVPDAEKLELRLPALSAQHKIAAILSAYDDLIENNTRRIAILEEMARMLYREWFVNFRFPGHESVPTVDSPLGPIPDGWKVRRASDAILVNPATRVSREGGKPFVPMSSLQDNSMLIDNIQMRSGNAGAKFRNGDTLFARITPCLENGKTAYVQFLSAGETAFGSTEFIVLRSKTLSPQLVYLLARSNEFRDNAIKSMSGASGRQRVRDACFDRFLFAHPPPDVVRAFTDGVSPLFGATHLLALKNANLRHTRDLLLPKLISGELHVGDLDIEVGEVGE